MYPSTHLAASLLLNEAYRGDRASAAAGAIVPDLIDKTLAWLLGVTPSGRYAAHSLAGAGVLTLATAWLAGPTRGASFGASYLCHLVGDLWEGGHVPWLMPFSLTLATAWLAGPTRGASFGASYLCHLVGDLWEGGHVPWLMPFRKYKPTERRWDLEITWSTVLLELAGIVLLARLAARWAKEER